MPLMPWQWIIVAFFFFLLMLATGSIVMMLSEEKQVRPLTFTVVARLYTTFPVFHTQHTTSRQACQCLGLHVSVCVQNEPALLVAANCFANVLYVFCSQLLLWNHTQRHVCICVCVCVCVCAELSFPLQTGAPIISLSFSSSVFLSRFLPLPLPARYPLFIPANYPCTAMGMCAFACAHAWHSASRWSNLLGPAVTIYPLPHPHVHACIYQIHLFFWCHRRIDARC